MLYAVKRCILITSSSYLPRILPSPPPRPSPPPPSPFVFSSFSACRLNLLPCTYFQSNSPFRNCKLTRILENALSGNSRTLLIATLSPKVSNRTESRNTLCFAQRASKLETRITVQKKVTKETLQRELKEQATLLKTKEKELAEMVRWIEAMDELIYTLKAMGVEDDYEERFDFATEHK